jgi:tetratricopeptide (TPR) repeat protein
LVAAVVLAAPGSSAQQLPATDLLDRYLKGEFDAVVADLQRHSTFDWLLDQLQRDGANWIDRGESATRERRTLAAATLALEAARIGQWTEWKHREQPPRMPGVRWYDEAGRQYIPEILFWAPPPRLIEWGCELFRRAGAAPRDAERLWQHAALAVAQRSEDGEFLFSEGLNRQLYNPKAEVDHLVHLTGRFPNESRFRLAVGTSLEWRLPDRAIAEFEALQNDPDVGGEARMRMGATHFRRGDHDRAIAAFRDAEVRSRDPWVLYLTRYLRGQALERRNRLPEAEQAYRAALAAVPGAQSASVSLATLLTRADRRTEAGDLVRGMFDHRPPVADPWRGYVHADDRFWPVLLARLRAEIRP